MCAVDPPVVVFNVLTLTENNVVCLTRRKVDILKSKLRRSNLKIKVDLSQLLDGNITGQVQPFLQWLCKNLDAERVEGVGYDLAVNRRDHLELEYYGADDIVLDYPEDVNMTEKDDFAYCVHPRVCTVETVTRKKQGVPHVLVDDVQFGMTDEEGVQMLQQTIDAKQGYVDMLDNQELDQQKLRDVCVNLPDDTVVRYNPMPRAPRDKIWDHMCPNIKTFCPERVDSPSLSQLLFSLTSRNFGARKREMPNGLTYKEAAAKLVKRAIFTTTDLRRKLPPLVLDVASWKGWLSKQEVGLETMVRKDVETMSNWNDYNMSLKPEPKPNLTNQASTVVQQSQVLAASNKAMNAYFGPIQRKLKELIFAHLNPNIILNSEMSTTELGEAMTAVLTPAEAAKVKALMVDISKYDKSQDEFDITLQVEFFRWFGLSDYDAELLLATYRETKLISKDLKVQAELAFQQKSGGPFTWLGNTILLLVCVATVLDLRRANLVVLGGDDSIIWTNENTDGIFDAFGMLFNFDAKLEKGSLMFCSKFVIDICNNWVLVPDPFKILVRLGRNDLRNEIHVEEYRRSLYDLTEALSDYRVVSILSRVLHAQYGLLFGEQMLVALRQTVSSKRRFQKLYEGEGLNLCYDTNFPKSFSSKKKY